MEGNRTEVRNILIRCALSIFRGRITGIATNPGEKTIETWFGVTSIVKFLFYSIYSRFNIEISPQYYAIE